MFEKTNVPFAAFVKAARVRNAEIIVPLYANASPSAPTDKAAFDAMSEAIVSAIAEGCDAVLLDLHGAMVAEGIDDAEGELLSGINQVAPDVPVAVALDFHSNLSDNFLRQPMLLRAIGLTLMWIRTRRVHARRTHCFDGSTAARSRMWPTGACPC